MTDFIAWHGKDLSKHITLRNEWAVKVYRFLSMSIHGSIADPIYSAVMIRRPVSVVQRDEPCMTLTQWRLTFNEQASQGYGPVILTAASDPRFAAVFEPQKPIPLTRKHGIPTIPP